MPRIPIEDPISYLVRRRFPDAHAIQSATFITESVTQLAPEYRAERRAQIDDYQAMLLSKPAQELERLLADERARESEEKAAKARREEDERFFNQRHAKADISYWGKMPYWSIEEALALSFGRDPARVKWDSIKPYQAYGSPFVAEYARLLSLLQRAVAVKQLGETNLPGFFLGWAKRNRFTYPPELEAAVVEHGNQVGDWKSLYDDLEKRHKEGEADHKALVEVMQARIDAGKRHYDELLALHDSQVKELVDAFNKVVAQRDAVGGERDGLASALAESKVQLEQALAVAEKPLHPSVRRSLLKLVLGMAIDKYQFKAEATKSAATQNIADALVRRGIRLDVDTVRARLQDAVGEVETETEKSA